MQRWQQPSRRPFVGRSDDIERMAELLDRSSIVVVEGLAGVGKTALAFEATRESGLRAVSLESLNERLVRGRRAELEGVSLLLDDADPLAGTTSRWDLGEIATKWSALVRGSRLVITTRRRLALGGTPHARLCLGPMPDSELEMLARIATDDFGPVDDVASMVQGAHGSPGRLLRTWVGEEDPLLSDLCSHPKEVDELWISHLLGEVGGDSMEYLFPSRLRRPHLGLVEAASIAALGERRADVVLRASRSFEREFEREGDRRSLVRALTLASELEEPKFVESLLERHRRSLILESGAAFTRALDAAARRSTIVRATWRDQRVKLHLGRGDVRSALGAARDSEELPTTEGNVMTAVIAVRQGRITEAVKALAAMSDIPAHWRAEALAWRGSDALATYLRATRIPKDGHDLDVAHAIASFVDQRFDHVVDALAECEMRPRTRRGLRVLALIELDRLEEADELAASLANDDFAELVHGTLAWARGQIDASLGMLSGVVRRRRQNEDRLFAGVASLLYGRALLARGDLARARDTFDEASEVFVDVPAFRVLAEVWATYSRVWTLEHDVVLTSVARILADPAASSRVRALAERGLAFVAALNGRADEARDRLQNTPLPEGDPGFLMEHELVRTELEMVLGRSPTGTIARAARAREYFARVGRRHLEARASVSLASALLERAEDTDFVRFDEALARSRTLARDHGYVLVEQRCAVLEAKRAVRAGRAAESSRILADALQGTEKKAAYVEALAIRLALDGSEEWEAPTGVSRYVQSLRTSSERRACVQGKWRRASAEELTKLRARHDVIVDRTSGTVETSRTIARPRPILVRMLASLAERHGEFVDAETLYREVWGGIEYHPLRHRNTLYVALNRTRRFLSDAGLGADVLRTGPQGWALEKSVDVIVMDD